MTLLHDIVFSQLHQDHKEGSLTPRPGDSQLLTSILIIAQWELHRDMDTDYMKLLPLRPRSKIMGHTITVRL